MMIRSFIRIRSFFFVSWSLLKKLNSFSSLLFALSPTPPPRCFSFSVLFALSPWPRSEHLQQAKKAGIRKLRETREIFPVPPSFAFNLHSESRLCLSESRKQINTSYNLTYKVCSRLYLVFFSSLSLAFVEVGKIIIRKSHSKQWWPDA